eukprot:sb/3465859/
MAKSGLEKFMVFLSFFLIVATFFVQLFFVQYEIGFLWLFIGPTLLFNSALVTNYWKCILVDSSAKSLKNVPHIQTDGWRYCPYDGCSGSVPVNSRHCHTCDVCIVQRDHHCHFTGSCIGKYNLPFFMVTVFSLLGISVTYLLSNFIFIVTHETPGTVILTVLAPMQLFWFLTGSVTFSHCLVSCNIVVSTMALAGAIVLCYHEYMLLFHNKPFLCRSMPIASSGVVKMSRMERIREVFGNKWYMFMVDPWTPNMAGAGWDRGTINHSSELSAQLGSLLEDTDIESDVMITCQGQEFPCHKAILAARSKYFRALLYVHPFPAPGPTTTGAGSQIRVDAPRNGYLFLSPDPNRHLQCCGDLPVGNILQPG